MFVSAVNALACPFPYFSAEGELVRESPRALNLPVPYHLPSSGLVPWQYAPLFSVTEALRCVPFDTDTDRLNYITGLLTPIVRALIQGPTPLFVISADAHGVGKTWLGTTMQEVLGLPVGVGMLADKVVQSVIIDGVRLALFDNCKKIESLMLERALSSQQLSLRRMYQRNEQTYAVSTVFVVTMNSGSSPLSPDLERRTVRVQLSRRKFDQYRDQAPERMDHDQILSDLVAMVQQWLAAGQPKPSVPASLGSHAEWWRVVGGILTFANGSWPVAEA